MAKLTTVTVVKEHNLLIDEDERLALLGALRYKLNYAASVGIVGIQEKLARLITALTAGKVN